jgi:hypothetical protein
LSTISADAANIAIAENELQGTLLEHTLPSRLPVLSMATQGRFIVAIDAGNAVFLSKDGGRRWKAIAAPWPGRAVKADLVMYPAGGSAALRRDKPALDAVRTADNNAPAGNAGDALAVQGRSLKELPGPSLTGTVTDATGAVIAGAWVSVADSASHTVRTVKTDGEGHYQVDGLAPGAYRVEAEAPGFEKQELAAVTVAANQWSVANLSLEVGAAAQTVTVEVSNAAIAEAKKTKARSVTATHAPPVVAITTDNGERWTSADGVTWKPM